jgi:hypothetical protein
MLHQVVIKRQQEKYLVTYEILNKKPKTKPDQLVMIALFYKLIFNKKVKNDYFGETDNGYALTGSFMMDSIKFEYRDVSNPPKILSKLITDETRDAISSILMAAGERECLSKEPS